MRSISYCGCLHFFFWGGGGSGNTTIYFRVEQWFHAKWKNSKMKFLWEFPELELKPFLSRISQFQFQIFKKRFNSNLNSGKLELIPEFNSFRINSLKVCSVSLPRDKFLTTRDESWYLRVRFPMHPSSGVSNNTSNKCLHLISQTISENSQKINF